MEAMLGGWRAQQTALVAGQVEGWTLSLTAERHLAAATICGYQTDLRLFSEHPTDARYGWAMAYEEAFGQFPAPICHERNTIAPSEHY